MTGAQKCLDCPIGTFSGIAASTCTPCAPGSQSAITKVCARHSRLPPRLDFESRCLRAGFVLHAVSCGPLQREPWRCQLHRVRRGHVPSVGRSQQLRQLSAWYAFCVEIAPSPDVCAIRDFQANTRRPPRRLRASTARPAPLRTCRARPSATSAQRARTNNSRAPPLVSDRENSPT